MSPVSPDIEKNAEKIFNDTLDSYIKSLEAEAANTFLLWLEEHSSDENLFAELLQHHPAFGNMFAEAVEKFDANH